MWTKLEQWLSIGAFLGSPMQRDLMKLLQRVFVNGKDAPNFRWERLNTNTKNSPKKHFELPKTLTLSPNSAIY